MVKKNYRPDIDGLRAIAVLSVLIYHIDSSLIPGGFLGVDIFFVISGYLITSIIYKDIGKFSFIEFYSRRVKRIAPALFVVVLTTLVAGYYILLPRDLYHLTNSAFSNIFFLSNVFFSRNTDYFAASSELYPLLHTWSLSVEEQFYLIWPLLLLCLVRYITKQKVIFISFLLAIFSFSLAQFASGQNDLASYSYYFSVTRAGELLVGAILAISNYQSCKSKHFSYIGICIIFLSLCLFNDQMLFPGFIATIPCVGVALVIIGGQKENPITKVLSHKWIVLIGLMSYSIYLWHWPILAYTRYIFDTSSLSFIASVNIVMFTLILSFLSWKFVEQPARSVKSISFTKLLSKYYLFPSFMILLLFTYSYVTSGIPERYGKGTEDYFVSGNNDGCVGVDVIETDCSIGAQLMNKNTTLLIGDSHASHIEVILDDLGKRRLFSIDAHHVGGCFPVFDVRSKHANTYLRKQCDVLRNFFKARIDDYNTVILAAAWSHRLFDKTYQEHLRQTLDELEALDKKVILIAQIPNFMKNYTKIYFASKGFIEQTPEKSNEYEKANNVLSRIAKNFKNVEYFDFEAHMPKGFFQKPIMDGKPLYLDSNHLSVWGSKYIGNNLPENPVFNSL